MSHHLDDPETRRDPRLNITDLYVFRGQTGTAFVTNVNPSLGGGPQGFHPEARYEVRIDGDGDLVPKLAYRVTFGQANSTGRQAVELRRITGAGAAGNATAGTVLATGHTGTTITADGGLKLWAGPAHDPFYLDGVPLHAIGEAFANGTTVNLGDWTPAIAKDVPFGADNLYSVVLEVPDADLHSVAHGGQISSWALVVLATDAGGWDCVNRVGIPMIQPIYAQLNDDLATQLNTEDPRYDRQLFADQLAKETAAVVAAYGNAADPAAYGLAVADKILPNVLPYTIGTAGVFGFGEWNGRSLTDNVPDVMFSLASNTAFTAGLTESSVPVQPTQTFPYVPVIG
jgi:hypothetical protein